MNKWILRFTLILTFFLTNIGSTHAYSIENFNTEIEINRDGTTNVFNQLILDSTTINEYIYIPTSNPTKITMADDEYELKYAEISNFLIVTPKERTNNYKIRLRYLTSTLTSKNKDIWTLTYSIPSPKSMNSEEIKHVGIIISLPKTSVLTSLPENGFVYEESGYLKVGMKLNLNESQDTEINIKYKIDPINQGIWKTDTFYAALVILCILIAIHFWRLHNKERNNKQNIKSQKNDFVEDLKEFINFIDIIDISKYKQILENKLKQRPIPEDIRKEIKKWDFWEKKIVDLLIKNKNDPRTKGENGMYQKDIYNILKTPLNKSYRKPEEEPNETKKINKTRLSRIINKLKINGIIKVEKLGNTNRICLSESYMYASYHAKLKNENTAN